MTGVALVLQDTRGASGLGIDPTKSVWFCSCTAANSNIWSQIQALHSAPGGCASLEDADCSHVRYLKHLFQNQSFTIEEIVMESPVYEDQDLADDQAQTLTTPVIDLGSVTTVRGKESSRLYQIGTYGSNQMTVGLVHRDKCVTCKGHFSKTSCAHTTALRKSAIDDESDSETDNFSDSEFSFHGKLSPKLFDASYKVYVNEEGTSLKLWCNSYRSFPMEGTTPAQDARAKRALHCWGNKTDSPDNISLTLLEDKNTLSKQGNGHDFSILFHTDGFYPVKDFQVLQTGLPHATEQTENQAKS